MRVLRVPLYGSLQDTAYFDAYLPDGVPAGQRRPAAVVVPGGAYQMVSAREGEPVALAFCGAGYQAAVVHYRVAPTRFPAALTDLAQTVRTLRLNAGRWFLDPDRVILCGFSAGGHLCASLGVYWNSGFLSRLIGERSELLRPNGMILGYPVITSGPAAHIPSIENLCGGDEQKRLAASLERHVSADTPPTFLWHTAEDGAVPVENSLLFARALTGCGVPFEMHVFPRGRHGLALASRVTSAGDETLIQPECQKWFPLALDWLARGFLRKALPECSPDRV